MKKFSTFAFAFIAASLLSVGCGTYDEDGTSTPPATNGGSGGGSAGSGGTGGSAGSGGSGGSASTDAGTTSDVPARTIVCKSTSRGLEVSLKGPILKTLVDGDIAGFTPLPGKPAFLSYGGANTGSWDPRAAEGKAAWMGDSVAYTLVLPPPANGFNLSVIDDQGHYKWLMASEWSLAGECKRYGGNGGTQILTN